MPFPSGFTPVTVQDLFLRDDGTPATGTLTATASTVLVNTTTGTVLDRMPMAGVLDASGALTAADGTSPFVLAATDDPTTAPVGGTYYWELRLDGTTQAFSAPLSHLTTPVVLSTLLPLVDAPSAPPPGVAAIIGINGVAAATAPSGVTTVQIDTAGATAGQVQKADGAGAVAWADESGGGAGGHIIADEGTALPAQPTLNFTGAGVTATNNAGASRTDVTIPGGASGAAGGVLSGTYPNPGFAVDMATQAELDAEATARASADGTHAALTTAAHGGIVASTDVRLTDARTPTAHAASHLSTGSDAIPGAVASGASGLLTGADKTKLDGITSGAGVVSVSGTAPVTSTGGSTPAIGLTAATPSAAGSMSGADKTKLDATAAKDPVRTATTGAITLSGPQTVNGVALIAGDRVLVKNQATGSQNGLYLVAAGAWTRTLDADTSVKVVTGLNVFIAEGTTLSGSVWYLTTANPITLDTTSLVFAQYSGLGLVTFTAPLSKAGNTVSLTAPLTVAQGGTNGITQAAARTGLGLGTAAVTDTGTGAGNTILGNDARLTDSRAPNGTASGDLTGSYPGPTLAAAGTAGTYAYPASLTTDSKGRVTAATAGSAPVGFANPMTTQDDLIIGGASGTPARLGKGSDGQVLTVDPTTHHLVWATPGGGGSYLPLAGGTMTGLIRHLGLQSDGGSARGANAVDLQTNRSDGTRIASGANAVVGGGQDNQATGTWAVAAGGFYNTATGDRAIIVGGSFNTASADFANILGGTSNTVSGVGGVVAGGNNNVVSGAHGAINGGFYALAALYGQQTQAAGAFATAGDAQTSTFVLRGDTTGGSAWYVWLDGSSLEITLATNRAFAYRILAVARNQTSGNVGAWEATGILARGAGAAALTGDTITTLANPDALTFGPITSPSSQLRVGITGLAANTVHWVCRVTLVEVE